jgi:TRAP-type C4-dicarboxylate transport system substrate-binding protein
MRNYVSRRPFRDRFDRRAARWLNAAGVVAMGLLLSVCVARANEPVELKVVGGLAGVSQYERLEKPFWEHQIETLSNGSIKAEIHAFDRSGLPGQEMLQLMRLGIVPFGTALLAVVSGDEPELNAVDLPALNPDMQALRKTVALYRSHLQQMLRTKFGIELLAVYAYPAQVIFCARPFTGLSDLVGRRIRTSSVGQSEMMAALGAIPVLTPFAEIVNSIRTGVVDCAITGTLSGNEIGLPNVTSYIYPMAISWGLSFFGANAAVWEALPTDLRTTLKEAIAGLEREIWDAADRETAAGLACDIGAPDCSGEHVLAAWCWSRSPRRTRPRGNGCWSSRCCRAGYSAVARIALTLGIENWRQRLASRQSQTEPPARPRNPGLKNLQSAAHFSAASNRR